MRENIRTYRINMDKKRTITGSPVFWFLFLFTMIFPPMYLPVDIRLPISLCWLLVFQKVIVLNDNFQKWILFIAVYSLLVISANAISGEQVDIGVVSIRYIRAMLTATVIASAFISVEAKKTDLIIQVLALILSIHSCIIVLEILFPVVKEWMFIFSGKSRIFYQYRANGFVNSYDFAGFFANVGVFINALLIAQQKRFRNYFFFIVCIVAALLTSRLNMLFCAMTLAFLFGKVRKQSMFLKVVIAVVLILVSSAFIFMWAITTDAFSSIRSYLFSKFSWMSSFYTLIRNTYSDDILSEQLQYQFHVSGRSVFQLIGTGSDPNRDPGYVQMLYSIGIVGTLMCVIPHIIISCRSYIMSKRQSFGFAQMAFLLLAYTATLELIMNFKLLFLYSTGAFEMLYILYLITIKLKDGNQYE